MIRRLKSDVLAQLPSKKREMVVLDPTLISTSKDMKGKAAQMQRKNLSNTEKRSLLLEWFNLTGKTKTKAVLAFVADVLEGESKFICFAHHQAMLDALQGLAEKKKVGFIRIDGSTPATLRHDLCERFQNDSVTKLALLSVSAANAGLTLTAASLVVFAELFWNPGVLTQAEDRAHRIGQTGRVQVKYLVAKGTADDELWPLLQNKLDVLNKAGLSKDNFLESDSSEHRGKKRESMEDYLKKDAMEDSLLAGLDLDSWEDDFCMETEEGPSPSKKCKI